MHDKLYSKRESYKGRFLFFNVSSQPPKYDKILQNLLR